MNFRLLLGLLLIGALGLTPQLQAQSFFDKVRDFGLRLSHPELQQKRTKRGGKRGAKTKSPNVAARPSPSPANSQQPPLAPAPIMATETPLAAEPPQTPAPASPPANDPAIRRATAEGAADLRRDLPYGVPVAGKPGFVTSPYAPRAGIVDVRGMPSGIEVKDPFSGKVFLTP